MPAYIETWDVTKPAGNRDISLGDDDIRELKRGLTERLGTDHEFQTDETGNNKIGYHKKVTLTKQATDPATVTDTGILYTKDVGSGVIELFYEDAAGNIIQLTKSGIPTRLSKEVIMWFGTVATIPTGLYLCNGSNGRPDLRDKFICGARQDSGGVAMTNVEGSLAQSAVPTHNHSGLTGGTTLSASQIPAHTHTIDIRTNDGNPGSLGAVGCAAAPNSTITSSSAGGGTSHDHSISAAATIPTYFALCFITPYNV